MTAQSNERQFAIKHLSELILEIPVAMVTTCRPDHTLTSRPMMNVNDSFDGDLWFFVRSDQALFRELVGNPQVNASFQSDDGMKFVSASGTAKQTQEKRRVELLWSDDCKDWFDQGCEDPNLSLIRVEVHHAEYWDSSKNAMVAITGFLQNLMGHEHKQRDIKHESIDWDEHQGQIY